MLKSFLLHQMQRLLERCVAPQRTVTPSKHGEYYSTVPSKRGSVQIVEGGGNLENFICVGVQISGVSKLRNQYLKIRHKIMLDPVLNGQGPIRLVL